MRKLRILILIFFVVVAAIFTFNRVQELLTTDSHAPVITADADSIQVSVSATDAELLQGMSAQDNLDGDVTNTLAVVSKSKFSTKGTLRVNYAAFDQNNNVGTYSRNVTYVDYVSPRFSLKRPLRFLNGNSDYDYLAYVQAEDCLDGNITGQIKMTLGDMTTVSDDISTRLLNLQVTNSAGDTSVLELPVTFENHNTFDEAAPALSDYVIYVKAGEKPTLSSYVSGVQTGNGVRNFSETRYNQSSDVNISDSGVNYAVPGVYTVTYQLSSTNNDGSRNPLGSAVQYVIVEG